MSLARIFCAMHKRAHGAKMHGALTTARKFAALPNWL